MRRVVQTVTGVANSPIIPLDHRAQEFNVGIQCVVSATATYNVQYTLDDIYNTPAGSITWTNVTTTIPTSGTVLAGASTNQVANITIPASALRLNVTASTGTVTITVLQSSGQG